jgi:hypothetical protein
MDTTTSSESHALRRTIARPEGWLGAGQTRAAAFSTPTRSLLSGIGPDPP